MATEVDKIITGVSRAIELKVKEEVYEQSKFKDQEVSALHREILERLDTLKDDVGGLKTTVDSHHQFIQDIKHIVKTGTYVRKFIIWVLLFVPTVAAFFAALKYIYDWFRNYSQ